jgi:hypothetical protein
MEEARSRHSAALDGGKMYVVGGLNVNDVPLHTVEAFDFTTSTWSLLAATTMLARHSHVSAVYVPPLMSLHICTFLLLQGWFKMARLLLLLGEAKHAWEWEPISHIFQEEAFAVLPITLLFGDCADMATLHKRYNHALHAVGGWGREGQRESVEVLEHCNGLPWSPARHQAFTTPFKRAVYWVMLSGVSDSLPPLSLSLSPPSPSAPPPSLCGVVFLRPEMCVPPSPLRFSYFALRAF